VSEKDTRQTDLFAECLPLTLSKPVTPAANHCNLFFLKIRTLPSALLIRHSAKGYIIFLENLFAECYVSGHPAKILQKKEKHFTE
jgi:hypothetical protein